MLYRLLSDKTHMTRVDGESSLLRALIGKTTSLLSVILQIQINAQAINLLANHYLQYKFVPLPT